MMTIGKYDIYLPSESPTKRTWIQINSGPREGEGMSTTSIELEFLSSRMEGVLDDFWEDHF